MTFEETRPVVDGTILRAVEADYTESEHRYRMIGSSALAVGTVGFNSTKIPLVTMPTIALEALQYSDNSLAAGVAAGLAYGGWTLLTTGFADRALNHIPATKSWLEHRHPTQVGLIIDAFPGLDENNDEEKSSTKLGARIGKSVVTHTVRGMTAVGAGANFYVVAAHLEEQPKPARHRLRRRLSIDGGLVMGTIAGASAEVVRQINDSNPLLAEQIHDGATNPWIGAGVAGSLMAVQGTKKQLSKRRLKAQALAVREQAAQEFAEID